MSDSIDNEFHILALDGGGIKGIFAAAFLAAVEDDLGTHVIDHFDLIAGTSTGGIIALGLGLGLSPREMLSFYVEDGRDIFANSLGWRGILQWVWRKYPLARLETALKRRLGGRLFGASSKRLVIPSYNLDENDVYIFRTPHHERLRRDYKVPAWQVGLATSAAPTFFQSFRGIQSLRLVDGGVWANNPTMVAVIEAHGTLGVPLQNIHVLSIGATDPVVAQGRRLNKGGIVAWGWKSAAIDVIMRGQSLAAGKHTRFLIGAENLLRINPVVAAGEFALDRLTTSEDLIAKAAHHSRELMPRINSEIASHKAAMYTPFYSAK